jgi:hypothetical protein
MEPTEIEKKFEELNNSISVVTKSVPLQKLEILNSLVENS